MSKSTPPALPGTKRAALSLPSKWLFGLGVVVGMVLVAHMVL
jgi:hypothetical protein